MPVFVAWSTPGAALLAATGATPGGFPAAVGAFVVVGLLLIAAGLIRPFGRLVAAIPDPLANAMLAGVLFGLCLKPIAALIEAPVGARPDRALVARRLALEADLRHPGRRARRRRR